MATNPYFTQYHTQRFSFIGSPQQRDGTTLKDQRFVNMYPELVKSELTDGKKYYLKKRPGTEFAFNYTGGTGVGSGIYYWQNLGNYYSVIGNVLYANSTPIQTLSHTPSHVGFAEFRNDVVDELFFADGQNGWIIHGDNTVTLITDGHFPTPHIPNPIYLDGYIFLAASGTQTIHNSTLNDPTTWPVDGIIDAEMYPDNIVGLTKSLNYLVVIGGQSIEFFYDNANATGSPLQRNAPAVSQFGCPASLSIQQTEQEVILVGTTNSGGRTVWVIQGFQPTEIASPPVREALDAEEAILSTATGMVLQCAGHKWYILNLKGNQRTFVYDFDEKMWHEWAFGSGQANFPYDFVADSGNGAPVLLSQAGGSAANLQPTNLTDAFGAPITCTVRTAKLDFDTVKRKRFFRLSLVADGPNLNVPVPMLVSWSDDDYNTFTTGVTLNLSGGYSTITQLGYARRRAFQFVYTQPYPLRMESFEVDLIQEVRR